MRGKIENLPKFAQDEIRRLEREVAYWQGVASIGPENSRAFANPYSDAPQPLGSDPHVQFITVPGEEGTRRGKIKVCLRDRHDGSTELEVYTDEGMLVKPQSSNVITVRSVPLGS